MTMAVILGVTQSVLFRMNDDDDNERTQLLGQGNQNGDGNDSNKETQPNSKTRAAVWGVLTLLFVIGLVPLLAFQDKLPEELFPWLGRLPSDPMLAALSILDKAPVIDGHIDLPMLARFLYKNNVTAIDLDSPMPAHVDIPRLREGKVGGFFWSVYVGCADPQEEGKDFINATWRVRDTLEQIDVARLLIDKYPETFQYAATSEDVKTAIRSGKIASLLGVEGGHQLGNSLAVLRQYHALGVRYMTLTHTCHNAFADSCGMAPGKKPLHHGLSAFGRSLIDEMNRLGVLVDLSHTSDDTARQALQYSKAPVIWSHSSARAVHDVPRNVPDDILALIGPGKGQNDAVVMVNFAPAFVAKPDEANVETVANHVDHIAQIAGKEHVGIGSDFDGIGDTPKGLEDVSQYPALIAELYKRGWNKYELAGLTGANFLRVFEGAERVARDIQISGRRPNFDLYKKRPDL
ncbi:hypothetical protein PTI98_006536 [Pleurotus ostreatus]|nr:hypothetical protein PTI98_006536 [Pleurotus ostreatus]